ncbi:MAG: serine hydrolase [Myxococcales bacterium]|nr:serine hydrolase [Myxococcales bacterium]
MRSWSRMAVVLLVVGCARGAAAAPPPPAAAARQWLATIRPASELQTFLERTMATLADFDPALRRAAVGVALLDLPSDGPPRLAHAGGDRPIYPASVVKFVYLMAAYRWQEEGRLVIDPGLDAELEAMIRESSNRATQKVFARLTDTAPGPELPPGEYARYRERRQVVKRWLQSLGIDDLHCVNPTYDGGGDLVGRDRQFLRDHGVAGGLVSADGEYPNRQAMTAIGTAKLLGLLATDRALTPEDSAAVRRRMKRDPKQQPHLARRIAGGAARIPGLEVYAKSGTWGPDYADAGIVRAPDGHQFALAVFTEATPAYRGELIAQLAHRAAEHLFGPQRQAGKALPRNWPMAPSVLDLKLALDDFEISEVKRAGAGVTGASRFTVRFADGRSMKVKWKPFPRPTLDGWNNSPRKEVAAYAIQRWIFDEDDYVVPTTVPRCIPVDVYRVLKDAKPTLPGSRCVLGLFAAWMEDVAVADDLNDDIDERVERDPHYGAHLADMNLLTYLIDHRDGRDGNFLISTDPEDPRVFSIDNGIAFEGFPWNFFVRNWNTLRVPWLRADPVARLRALPPEEVERLSTLFDMDVDAAGIFRLGRRTAPLDPAKGVRIARGKIQLGLTAGEIGRLQQRIAALLADVDAGRVRVR